MATRRANRGHGDPLPGGLPAIMLGVDDEGDLVWSPAVAPPGVVGALLETADTVDGPWTDHVTVGWADQPWTIDISHVAWRLIGLDGVGDPATLPSNVVDLL